MFDSWLSGLLLMVALAMIGLVARGLRRGSRLQRRLFVSMLILSWLPALLVLALQWQLQRRSLEVLESPGLTGALDSALELARRVRGLESDTARSLAFDLAARLARDEAEPLVPEGCGYEVRRRDTGEVLRRAGERWSLPTAARPGAEGQWDRTGESGPGTPVGESAAVSIELDGRPLHLVRAGVTEETELWLVAPRDPELAAMVQDVGRATTRLRQMGAFYGRILQGDTLLTLVLFTLVCLLASLFVSGRLAGQIGTPLRDLVQATNAVAAGDLDHRVRTKAVDELDDLVVAFNAMTDDLRDSKEQLQRSERIAAWQGVARRLAHEIKNPLTPIHLSIHRLRRQLDDPALVECLDTVLEETANLKRLADEFSLYARLPEPRKQKIRPRALLEQVVDLYGGRRRVEVKWSDWPEDDEVAADEGQMRQVLSNLVKNAMEAMKERGRLTLRARRDDRWLRLEIEDDGEGLPGDPSRIFDPDFSTKASGSGLGLAISRKILEDHGGCLSAHAAPGRGSVFVVELPLRGE